MHLPALRRGPGALPRTAPPPLALPGAPGAHAAGPDPHRGTTCAQAGWGHTSAGPPRLARPNFPAPRGQPSLGGETP